MRKITAALCLLLLLSFPLFASGGQEPADGRTTTYGDAALTLYAIAETGSEAEMYTIDRMTIPSMITMFAWMPFNLKNGELTTESASAYALRSKTLSATIRAQGVIVLEYRITAAISGADKARTSQEVSFSVKDCLGAKGEVLYQPGRMALIRAVGMRTLSSGQVRISRLSYADGVFTAIVEFK